MLFDRASAAFVLVVFTNLKRVFTLESETTETNADACSQSSTNINMVITPLVLY